MKHIYLCIDLKTFYASVECVERGLNPDTTNLIVADETRGKGAISLAISPKLKALGVRNRCRVYEIPEGIEYMIAKPRMLLYMQYAADIYAIYLKYIAKEDIHVYSIDEAFLDVTTYTTLYEKSAKEIAQMIMNDIYDTLHIRSSAGIGTNLYLAKIALDILAKHNENHVAYLDETLYKEQLWNHQPITDFWQIGNGIANRLYKYGIETMHEITQCPNKVILKEFGINGQYLIDHAYGKESTTIQDIKRYEPKATSMNNSQILFEDYTYEEAMIVVKEMIEVNVLQLVKRHVVTNRIGLRVGYSKDVISPSGGQRKLELKTNSYMLLKEEFMKLFIETTSPYHFIRSISLSFGNIVDDIHETYTLFSDIEALEKEKQLQETLVEIKSKYGKNAVLKGMNVQEKATAKKRNTLVGGHNAK